MTSRSPRSPRSRHPGAAAVALALAFALSAPALAAAQTWWFSRRPEDPQRIGAPGKTRLVVGNLGRGYLGVRLIGLTDDLKEFYGAADGAGVLVSSVEEDSPAAAAGLRVGDLITAVDGEPTEAPREVVRAVGRLEPEEQVEITVVRDRAPVTLRAAVGEREGAVWFSGDRALPDLEELALFREELPRVVLDSEEAREAMREAFEQAREQMETIDFGEMAERLAEAEERLRELERQLAERGRPE